MNFRDRLATLWERSPVWGLGESEATWLAQVGLTPSIRFGGTLPRWLVECAEEPPGQSSRDDAAELRWFVLPDRSNLFVRSESEAIRLPAVSARDDDARVLLFSDQPASAIDPTWVCRIASSVLLPISGAVCLHGAAVSIDETAVLLIGPSGEGKSTAIETFLRGGDGILADEHAPVRQRDGVFEALPGFPAADLAPDADAVSPLADIARRIVPLNNGKMRYVLDSADPRVDQEARPIAAIYLLSSAGEPGRVELEPLPGRSGFLALMRNGCNLVSDDATVLRRTRDLLAGLATAIGVIELRLGRTGPESKALVREAILDDLAARATRHRARI